MKVYEGTRELTEAELADQTTKLQLAVAVSLLRPPPDSLNRINGVYESSEPTQRAIEGLE